MAIPRLAQASRLLVSRARRLTVRARRPPRVAAQTVLQTATQVATQAQLRQTVAAPLARVTVAQLALRAGRPAILPVAPKANRAQHAILKKVLRHRFTDLGACRHHDLGARLDGQHARKRGAGFFIAHSVVWL